MIMISSSSWEETPMQLKTDIHFIIILAWLAIFLLVISLLVIVFLIWYFYRYLQKSFDGFMNTATGKSPATGMENDGNEWKSLTLPRGPRRRFRSLRRGFRSVGNNRETQRRKLKRGEETRKHVGRDFVEVAAVSAVRRGRWKDFHSGHNSWEEWQVQGNEQQKRFEQMETTLIPSDRALCEGVWTILGGGEDMPTRPEN